MVYSIWTTYDTVETWALGVVGAVGASLLLLGGLYVFGGDDATDQRDLGSEPDPNAQSGQSALSVSVTDEIHDDGEFAYPGGSDGEASGEAADDAVSRRTNGDEQTATPKHDRGDSVSDGNSPEGTTDA